MAVYVLGQCGYEPHDIKYHVPLYEINQIMHAHMLAQGVTLDWEVYTEDKELTEAFNRIKDDWNHRQSRL